MDNLCELQPPEAPFADLEEQVVALYGGQFSFVKFLESERDRNYLLEWRRPAPSGSAAKAILKVSCRADSEALIRLQTEAMVLCHGRGCRVQEIFDGLAGGKLTSLQIGGQRFLSRMISYVEGEVLSSLSSPGDDGAALALQVAAWAAAGREMGKVSKCLDELYASRSTPAGEAPAGAPWDALDADFEWNLSNMSKVVRKYLPYFDRAPDGDHSEASTLLARKRQRVEELLRRHEEKYSGGAGSGQRQTLTHHDPNDNNIVFRRASAADATSEPEVEVAILDFGDMGLSYWFADAAIGHAYAPSREAGDGFVAGWLESVLGDPGHDAGGRASHELVRDWSLMRQVTSVCISNFQAARDPGNEYLQCSAAPLWRQLGVPE